MPKESRRQSEQQQYFQQSTKEKAVQQLLEAVPKKKQQLVKDLVTTLNVRKEVKNKLYKTTANTLESTVEKYNTQLNECATKITKISKELGPDLTKEVQNIVNMKIEPEKQNTQVKTQKRAVRKPENVRDTLENIDAGRYQVTEFKDLIKQAEEKLDKKGFFSKLFNKKGINKLKTDIYEFKEGVNRVYLAHPSLKEEFGDHKQKKEPTFSEIKTARRVTRLETQINSAKTKSQVQPTKPLSKGNQQQHL